MQPSLRRVFVRVGLSAAIVVWAVAALADVTMEEDPGRRPQRALLRGAEGVAFVDDRSCRGCHEEQTKRWRTSHHALAMQAADAGSVLGDFSGVRFEHRGVVSRFFERDGRYFVNSEGPDGRLADFEIAYTFGVEPLQQYLVHFPGGRLQALGIAWDTQARRWFHLYPDERIGHRDPLHWTGRYQRWNLMCAECHSTDLRRGYDATSDTYRTTWAEINVACQACHGPGERHVAWAEAGTPREAGSGGGGLVVDLAAASGPEAVEACARCHSRRRGVSEEDVHGRPLLDDFLPRSLDESFYYVDGQILDEVYVYGSFVQSRMHQAGVRCSDCHEPHDLSLRAPGDALCLRCHQLEPDARFPQLQSRRYDTPEHHQHPQASAGARCVACHMPSRKYMVVDPRRDHSMRVPRPDLSQKLGVPNACNDCHSDRSPAWAAAAVAEHHGPMRRRGADFAEAIHDGRSGAPTAAPALVKLAESTSLPGIVRATALRLLPRYGSPGLRAAALATQDPDPLVRESAVAALTQLPPADRLALLAPLLEDPIRAVRLEAARGLAGVSEEGLSDEGRERLHAALAEYERVQISQADMPGSRLNLAVLYTQLGRHQEAEQAYLRAIELDASFLPARVNLAHLYDGLGRKADAEAVLRAAVLQAPEQGELHYSLGLLLGEQGRMQEAASELELAAQRIPERARIHYNLALARQHLGERARAEASLLRAHQLEPTDPSIVQALVILYVQQAQPQQALPFARKLVELVPDQPGPGRLLQELEAELSR